jgi:hypothetical protein
MNMTLSKEVMPNYPWHNHDLLDEFARFLRKNFFSEEIARRIQQDPGATATRDSGFHLVYNEARFQSDAATTDGNLPMWRAIFDRIVRILDIGLPYQLIVSAWWRA